MHFMMWGGFSLGLDVSCNQSFSLTTRWWAQSVQTRLLEKSVDIIYDFFGLRGRASSEIEGVRMMTHSTSEINVRDLSS